MSSEVFQPRPSQESSFLLLTVPRGNLGRALVYPFKAEAVVVLTLPALGRIKNTVHVKHLLGCLACTQTAELLSINEAQRMNICPRSHH